MEGAAEQADVVAAKHTPLHEEHVRLNGKMVAFAGFEMPVHYPTGIVGEHRAVRERAGIFDVSHMGEIDVSGPDALALVQQVTTNDASKIDVGQAQYSVMCADDGGMLDDCLVYRFPEHYTFVVNASNIDADREWIEAAAEDFDARVFDRSEETALIALQGPESEAILSALADRDLAEIGYYRFQEGEVAGQPGVISRTGYTGEDGFELYLPRECAVPVWRALLEAGEGSGLEPAGLGARDSLRLEMGYALYGNDLDRGHTPLEAGLGWVVKPDSGHFFGRGVLEEQKEQGVGERLVGFVLNDRGFPRPGYELRHEGQSVGKVTSGVHSPSLGRGIGMGYVDSSAAKTGTGVDVMIRGRAVAAEVVRPPFYRQGSLRR